MNRVLAAGLLALPLVVATSTPAVAQQPIVAGTYFPTAFGGGSHLGSGSGGFCFRFLNGIHHHGPLFNYGPYSGYYPFEPYGPWTSDLRYTGPRGPLSGDCADGSCGNCKGCRTRLLGNGLGHNLGWGKSACGDCGSCGNCKAWGAYAKSTMTNVFHRSHPLSHKCHGKACETVAEPAPAAGCVGCAAAAALADKLPEPVAVKEPAAVEQSGGVEQAVYPRRER
jgi:hypothetical protein